MTIVTMVVPMEMMKLLNRFGRMEPEPNSTSR